MNKSNRTVTFIFLASMAMLLSILLQNWFFPPNIPENEQAPAVAAQQDDAAADSGLEADEDQDPAASESGDDDAPPLEAQDPNPHRLVTIGSLDPASNQRFLVTLNSHGATIRRIESSARNRKGRLLYREIEHQGGYLGSLELTDALTGAQIGVAGPGTPAAKAGLKPGDVITRINGEPVVDAEGLQKLLDLKKFKPGTDVQIDAQRGSGDSIEELSVAARLTDRPLEFVRPEPDTINPGFDFPESFELTLRNPIGETNWEEIDESLRLANWKTTEKSNEEGHQIVEFSIDIPAEKLKKFDLDGPLTVVKRYWLEPFTDERIEAPKSTRSWHLYFEIEIINRSEQAQKIAYQLQGPTGLPTEGWWYQMKIDGGGGFGLAGARDVVGSSVGDSYVFEGAPGLVSNLQKSPDRQEKKYIFDPYEDPEYQQVNFVGVDTLYFHTSLLPITAEGEKFSCYSAMAWPTSDRFPKKKKLHHLVDCTPVMFVDLEMEPGETYRQSFEIFSGPKERDVLEAYGLEDNRAFGWFEIFGKPLTWLLKIFYQLTFQLSYAIPIILLTILVRSMMIPISRKAAMNAQMMQFLSPQMKAIKEKYPDDMQKQAAAQKALFRKYNYNPLSGCLMGFVQIPIFIGLYRGLSVDIALRDQPLIPGLSWCNNLAAPDHLLDWSGWMPAFISNPEGWLGPYLNILPLVTVVLFVVNMKLFTPPPTDEQQAMMQKVMSFMMLFMGFLFYKVPAALCLYFITSSIWGIVERLLLPKPKLDTSKLDSFDLDTELKQGVPKPGSNGASESLSNKQAVEERKKRDKERRKRLKHRS